jgi:hypothetical protein
MAAEAVVSTKCRESTWSLLRRAADRRCEPLLDLTDRALRPFCERIVHGDPEPLGPEGVAAIVTMIARVTGESCEACLNRLISRAVLEEFAWIVCP